MPDSFWPMDCSTPGFPILCHRRSWLKLMSIESVMVSHPTISSSVVPFFSCPQSFPSSGLFPMSWLFASGGQSSGASALASVLPMNIQGWFPLGLTGLISLLYKGLSRVFSSTTSYCVLFLDEFQTCYHFSSNFLIAWLSSTWIAITSLGRLLTFC